MKMRANPLNSPNDVKSVDTVVYEKNVYARVQHLIDFLDSKQGRGVLAVSVSLLRNELSDLIDETLN